MPVEALIQLANEGTVGVGQYHLDSTTCQLCKRSPELLLVFSAKAVATVAREATGGADGVVRRIQVDKILLIHGPVQNIKKLPTADVALLNSGMILQKFERGSNT